MSKNGFTLIELIIVLTIAFILIGGATITYNRFNEEKKLNQEASNLLEVLKLAQIKTRNGDVGSSFCSRYEVKIESTQYTLNNGNCGINPTIHTFSQNISASSTSFPVIYRMNSVNDSKGFTELFQVATDGSVGSALPIDTTTIKMKHLILNKCINIKMTAVGSVTMSAPYTTGC